MSRYRRMKLSDHRGRDATVLLFNCTVKTEKNFCDAGNQPVRHHRLIKSTGETNYQSLQSIYDDSESLAEALIFSDPEIDMEICGRETGPCERVYIDVAGKPLYAVSTIEVIYNPDGTEKDRLQVSQTPANINGESPLRWSKRLITKNDATRRFAFTRKYQVRHVDGLTFDFLYGIAEYLQQNNSMVPVGSGLKGDGPLILECNGTPYRGFLEGRISDDSYLLILHLASFELRPPESIP